MKKLLLTFLLLIGTQNLSIAQTRNYLEVNAGLEADPADVNNDPYGNGWMIKVKLAEGADLSSLMDAAAYEALVG